MKNSFSKILKITLFVILFKYSFIDQIFQNFILFTYIMIWFCLSYPAIIGPKSI
jgi:hypothetical protein